MPRWGEENGEVGVRWKGAERELRGAVSGTCLSALHSCEVRRQHERDEPAAEQGGKEGQGEGGMHEREWKGAPRIATHATRNAFARSPSSLQRNSTACHGFAKNCCHTDKHPASDVWAGSFTGGLTVPSARGTGDAGGRCNADGAASPQLR